MGYNNISNSNNNNTKRLWRVDPFPARKKNKGQINTKKQNI